MQFLLLRTNPSPLDRLLPSFFQLLTKLAACLPTIGRRKITHEKETVGGDADGRRFYVRVPGVGRHSHWRAAAAQSGPRPAGESGPRIRLGGWILVSGQRPLRVARGILESPALCRSPV